MKVVILCGGLGTRLREETEFKPKPMVEIGGKPIVWHIMKLYAAHGFKEFVLCLGYKGDVIRDFFYNYEMRTRDVTVTLGARKAVEFHDTPPENGWKVTLAETGASSMTGARVKRVARYLDDEPFLLTYGDGLSDVNIQELVSFHKAKGRIATMMGVRPPSRFGELVAEGDRVLQFAEKPQLGAGSISGGFFVFQPEFLDYLSEGDGCVLEGLPLERLARQGDLGVFRHEGFWQCMDTYRDFELLNKIWDSKQVPWKVWENGQPALAR